jgi:hypothetical protein
MTWSPTLTVIVASTATLRRMPACVQTLLQCRDSERVEVILAYAADNDQNFPAYMADQDVLFLPMKPEITLPQLLAQAIAAARGEIVAITDATCAIDSRWVSAVLAAHENSHPIVGGAVEPGELASLVDWAGYFCDYGAFMYPLCSDVVPHVPGINISMKRWALDKGRAFVEGKFWKAFWCKELKGEGYRLRMDPSMLVYYRRSFSLWSLLRARFDHGRCFAGMRLAQFTPWQRWLYVLASPLLPWVFCFRFLRTLLPKRRHVCYLVFSFPVIALAMVAWALGEFCGYVAGSGTSCERIR